MIVQVLDTRMSIVRLVFSPVNGAGLDSVVYIAAIKMCHASSSSRIVATMLLFNLFPRQRAPLRRDAFTFGNFCFMAVRRCAQRRGRGLYLGLCGGNRPGGSLNAVLVVVLTLLPLLTTSTTLLGFGVI